MNKDRKKSLKQVAHYAGWPTLALYQDPDRKKGRNFDQPLLV